MSRSGRGNLCNCKGIYVITKSTVVFKLASFWPSDTWTRAIAFMKSNYRTGLESGLAGCDKQPKMRCCLFRQAHRYLVSIAPHPPCQHGRFFAIAPMIYRLQRVKVVSASRITLTHDGLILLWSCANPFSTSNLKLKIQRNAWKMRVKSQNISFHRGYYWSLLPITRNDFPESWLNLRACSTRQLSSTSNF